MHKVQNLTFTGIALILAGLAMLASEKIGIDTAKVLIPLLFIGGGVCSVLFSRANAQIVGIGQYHLIQGIGLMLFGVTLSLVPNTLGEFLNYSMYFVLIYGIMEIMISFTIVNSNSNFKWSDLISRFFGGFFGLIGGVLIIATSATDQVSGLMITGVVTALIGVGVLLFSTQLKK